MTAREIHEDELIALRDAARGVSSRQGRRPPAMSEEIKNRLIGTRDVLVEKRVRLLEIIDGMREQVRTIDRQIADCAAACRVFGIDITFPDALPSRIFSLPGKTISSIVQDRLRECKDGFLVREQRAGIEQEYGRPVHDKTIGVALGRLKNQGLASRTGHVWFPQGGLVP